VEPSTTARLRMALVKATVPGFIRRRSTAVARGPRNLTCVLKAFWTADARSGHLCYRAVDDLLVLW
jgi:hypothetical protein